VKASQGASRSTRATPITTLPSSSSTFFAIFGFSVALLFSAPLQ
jgi:hypothetical protein